MKHLADPAGPAAALLVASLLAPAVAAQTSRSDLLEALRAPGTLQSRIRFDHVTTADGLSNDSVFAILQDRDGFLWFGTQAGLNRYDGYRITQFRYDSRNPNSLGYDFVHFILQDSRGPIWTGNTLTRFDPQTETFKRFPLPGPHELQGAAEDGTGFLWLAMSGGRSLLRLEPATGAVVPFEIGGESPQQKETPIVSVFRDRDGIIWLGGRELIRFDASKGTFTRYSPEAANIRAIAQDRAGKLWLANTEGAQNFFDPIAGVFGRRWGPPNRERLGTPASAIAVGEDGVVWRGASDRLELFDPVTGAFGFLRHDAADRYSLSGNEILSLAFDRDGNLWVGTKEGVDRFSPGALQFGAWRRDPANPNGLSDGNVRAIYRDRADSVWIGTYNGGLDRLDPVSGGFVHYRHDSRRPASLDADRVYSIYEDRSGALWVGTDRGINRLDPRTGAFTHFKRGPLDEGGAAIPTYSFLEDHQGRFWFVNGEKRAVLDRQTGAVKPLPDIFGLSMHEDRNGNLWLASRRGIAIMDTAGKVREIALPIAGESADPPFPQINYIHEDPQGLLWLATQTGLIRFDPRSESRTTYTTHEGLPDDVVQCALSDRAGNLWLSTNNGISRFNPRDNTFVNYHESDGLQGEQFNRKSCFVDPSGIMYFGGSHGFNVFDPARIPPNPRPRRVLLTGLQINGNTIPVRPGSVLPKPPWQMDTLTLSSKDEEFALEFADLTFRDQVRTRYRYRLEPLERRWTEVDSRSRSARYTGLRPGEYRFRVQASTDGRTWNGQEASLAISIPPPWWQTWWSRTAAFLAVASLFFGAYQWRVRSLHEREARLQNLVDRRTAELLNARNQAEKARKEAESARDQAERANRAKSTFLAHMSHELRTPLNAILGFSNILHGHTASENDRKDLEIINRSGEHLLTLINDILDVAKIEAGRTVLEISPCDLHALVQDVADMMGVRAAEKGLELLVREDGDIPRHIQADAPKLREILINLLGNAVKYTERGSVALRLSATPATEGKRLLRIDVEDTGIGIAPEDQARIFKPFEQVAKGASQKGTGLGLTITKEVVELMGGTIGVESVPGRGSRFRVEIPVEPGEGMEAKTPAGRERILGLAAGQPEYRILVVDDERENWMVLERLLRDAGFQVRIAENGEQAIERFRDWSPHFIWMDLRMPGMNGLEAARRIREMEGGSSVKIAAVTASGLESQRGDVLAAGLDDYIRKPYRPDEIFECMGRRMGVQYRRAHPTVEATAESGITQLSLEAMAALPASLRGELRSAVITLNAERISQAIGRVTEYDRALGSALRRYAQTFAYTPILNAIEAGNGDAEASGGV